jgi:hypothetical protein
VSQGTLLDVGKSLRPPSLAKPKPPESESDEFYTFRALVAFVEELLGLSFTVDCCATAKSAKCARFYTVADDGLRQDYSGEVVWNNPPYSDLGPWLLLALFWLERTGGARAWVHLIPGNRGDQGYYATAVEPFRDLPPDRIRVFREVRCPNGKLLRVPVVVPCEPRSFTVECKNIEGRIPFGFPGDEEGLTSAGGSFPSQLVIWRRAEIDR